MDYSNAISGINWLGVIVAALSTLFVGGLWYSPLIFGKKWMTSNGFSEEDLKKGSAIKVLGGTFILAFFAAFSLAMFIGPNSNPSFAATAGFMVGFFWIAAAFGIVYLFEKRSFKHFMINAGYFIVSFTIMGLILGIWK